MKVTRTTHAPNNLKFAGGRGNPATSRQQHQQKAIFRMDKDHALWINGENSRPFAVCQGFVLKGKVVDADGRNPAYLIKFDSVLGKKVHVVLPVASMNSNDKMFRLLTDSGFEFPHAKIKNRMTALRMYLEDYCPTDVVYLRTVRDGWVVGPDGKLVYVFGDRVLGNASTKLKVFRTQAPKAARKGTGKDWIKLNKQLGDEPNAVLVACASLSSVLLYPFGLDSILLFLIGSSGSGKTALLKYGSSLFDEPSSLLTWAGTDNGIEASVLQRQHKNFVIDEVGQATPQQFERLSYLLTNAAGKLRADTQGRAVASQKTHSVGISAGEIAPVDWIEAKGGIAKQGQVARLIAVPTGMKHGVWSDVGEHQDGAAKTHYLLHEIDRVHGIAAERFCELIAGRVRQHRALFNAVSEDFARDICPEVHDHSGDSVPRRVLRHFALFAFAGLLAIEHKVLPWSDTQVFNAMRVTYLRWLTEYQARQPKTANSLLAPVRLFMESQRGSKFKALNTWRTDHEGTVAGFEHTFRDGDECFLFYPAFFSSQFCGEHADTLVLDALKNAGYLRAGPRGVPSIQVNMPGGGKGAKRGFYAVRSSILLG
jgi:putative DNA primase/helicase